MRRLIKTPAVIARAPFGFAQGKLRARSNLTLLLILLSIAVTAPISAEEIKLTTIVPDQTILRTKKAALGNTYSNPDPLTGGISNNSIPTSGLLVQGNVGIGTANPATKLDVNGIMRLAPKAQPALGTEIPGMIYYDSTANTMRYYKGGASPGWVDLGGAEGGGAFGIWSRLGTNWWGISPGWGTGMNFSTDVIVVASADNCANLVGYIGNTVRARSQSATGVLATRCITLPVRNNDTLQVAASSGSINKKLLALPIQ